MLGEFTRLANDKDAFILYLSGKMTFAEAYRWKNEKRKQFKADRKRFEKLFS